MEVTEEQRRRAETNRLAALEKRKRAAEAAGGDPWGLFRCKKVVSNTTKPILPPPIPTPVRFRVVLEICSPDEFSVVPEKVPEFEFPEVEDCFRRIEACLSVNPFRSIESQVGRKTIYRLSDYEMVLNCLKKLHGLELQEIPYKTRRVVENFCCSLGDRWIPCMPHHLSDTDVDQLIEKLPENLRTRLLPFQLEGIRFGLRRGGRCLIADEMGLGKTLQAMTIAYCFINEGPILVVCPAILRYSWAEEFERWFPFCLPTEIHLVFGHQSSLHRAAVSPKVVVISYTMLHRLRDSMYKHHWAVMIVDESHNVRCTKKKTESGETAAVLDMAAKINRVILLSGTPSLSRPFDIFHQINMLWPKLLGNDKYEFANKYCAAQIVKGSEGRIYKDFSRGIRLEELNVLLRQTLMIRRLKANVLSQLPPKRRQIIRLNLKGSDISLATSACRKELVLQGDGCGNESTDVCPHQDDFAGEGRSEDRVANPVKNISTRTSKSKELSYQELGIAKLSGFQEWLSNHSITADSGIPCDLDIESPSRNMIIFAHHIKVLDGIQEFICTKGIQFVRIDGSTSARDRQAAVEAFRSSPKVKIVLIGITAGGVGLDFSSAQNVVFVELPKSASEMLQAEDRAHRRGQTNAVNIYIFCAMDSLDESHWLHLNRSLFRVSAMMNGKVNAVKEIEVDRVHCVESVDNAGKFPSCASSVGSAAVTSDSEVICEDVDCLSGEIQLEKDKAVPVLDDSSQFQGSKLDSVNVVDKNSLLGGLSVGDRSSCEKSHEESECNNSDDLEDAKTDIICPSQFNIAKQQKQLANNFSVLKNQSHCGDETVAVGDGCIVITPEALRFEVSQHTGRIHLYVCTLGTDSRPRPLFESFQPEDLDSMITFCNNKKKETSRLSAKENPVYWDVFRLFTKEWSNLRAIERSKLLGKPLQLPLYLELCYLKETNNHGPEGLIRGGSKRRTTPMSEVNGNLPENAVWKNITLRKGSEREKDYVQACTELGVPLCKLCQNPCKHKLAETPEYFEDLFCDLSCFEEYRFRTSQRSLRMALFQIEHGVCTQCKLDCHKLAKNLRPLSIERRREFIKEFAPKLVEKEKLLERIVSEPTEGNAWHADHIVPVYKGGGECRLENMRTLCVVCHADVTAAQRAERWLSKIKAKKQLKDAMNEVKRKMTSSGSSEQVQESKNGIEDDLFVLVPGSSYSSKNK